MTTPRTLLTKVRAEGFRSIKDSTVDLGPINVLIGPNGAGKSNLLGVLRLVPLMRTQSLRRYVGEQGGADRLLHYARLARHSEREASRRVARWQALHTRLLRPAGAPA